VVSEAYSGFLFHCYLEAYVNTARPHHGIGQAIPSARAPAPTAHPTAPIVAIPVLGGLHHDYRRTA